MLSNPLQPSPLVSSSRRVRLRGHIARVRGYGARRATRHSRRVPQQTPQARASLSRDGIAHPSTPSLLLVRAKCTTLPSPPLKKSVFPRKRYDHSKIDLSPVCALLVRPLSVAPRQQLPPCWPSGLLPGTRLKKGRRWARPGLEIRLPSPPPFSTAVDGAAEDRNVHSITQGQLQRGRTRRLHPK